MDTTRRFITVELVRSEQAGEPFAFQFTAQQYLLRAEDGTYRSAHFAWDARIFNDLAELAKPSPDGAALQRLGNALQAFLVEAGWEAQQAALIKALEEGRQVSVTFRFAAAELYALPWELVTLGTSGEHLIELPGCSIHYEWPGARRAVPGMPGASRVGRLLYAWSAAGGAVPATEHLAALREACAASHSPFDERCDVIPELSLPALARALAESTEPIAALHILCHGSRTASGAYGLLWNSGEAGEGAALIDPEELKRVLVPYAGSIQMVVLCACQSGNVGPPDNPMGSVAQMLHRAGIPAVVASRLPLSFAGSVQLTKTLYEQLLVRLASVQGALAAVRQRLKQEVEHLDWLSLQLYIRGQGGGDLHPFAFRPYRGLAPFEPEHRPFFFGRSKLADTLWRRLMDAQQGTLPRLQVVVGNSGTGKTSLVMAGVVPDLPAESWSCVVLRPGEGVALPAPRGAARCASVAALRTELHQQWHPCREPSAATATPEEVLEEARRLRSARPQRTLLLVVDSFEEVFTRLPATERQIFVDTLMRLAQAHELGIVVLALLRADYVERFGALAAGGGESWLKTVLSDDTHRLSVPPLEPEQLRSIIEEPARRVGVQLADGLVELLLEDIEHEPGALPLLQHALDLLWEQKKDNQLTHEAYEAFGGIERAVTSGMERVFGTLSLAEQQQARRLLVALVNPGDEERPFTRRRVGLRELRAASGQAQAAFDALFEKLVSRRLLIAGFEPEGEGAPWVEVAHEALLNDWALLAGWWQLDGPAELEARERSDWERQSQRLLEAAGSSGQPGRAWRRVVVGALIRSARSLLTAARALTPESRLKASLRRRPRRWQVRSTPKPPGQRK